MKREQLIKVLKKHIGECVISEDDADYLLFHLTKAILSLPLDTPSEEEIKEESLNGQINLHDHNWMNWLNDEEQGLFIMAAKWAINEIIERNK